jgi:autotransporter-associated beta strand protein
MKKTLSTLFCNMVTKQGLLKSDNGIVFSRNRSFRFPSFKLAYLLFVLIAFGGNVLAQQDIYWRSGAATNNWWDGNNPWYRTCDTWWLARPDYNVCSNNTTIGGNYIHFDNNNRTSMTVNGAWFKALTITFETTATSSRTFTADVSGGLSFTASISYLTNLSSATHTFNTGIGVDNNTLTINASNGALIFNNPIYINANALTFTGGNNSTSNGEISGTGSLTKSGLGILTLNGTNSYTGSTLVSVGTLATSTSLSSTLISVSNTATFSVTNNISVNSITLDNGSTLNIASDKTLTVNGTLTLSGSVTTSGGGTIAYGPNGVLTYNATNFSTTSDVEFPANNGPKDLNITVANASGITLHANRTIAGNLSIATDQKMIIPSSTSFISTTVSGAGQATVKRFIDSDAKWHFLSSPVWGQIICDGNFAPTDFAANYNSTIGATYDFYQWSELTSMITGQPWINLKKGDWSLNKIDFGGATPTFTVGKGYLVDYAANFDGSTTKSFTGTLIAGSQNIALTTGGNTWNLIGNPFSSAVLWDNVTTSGILADGYYYIYNELKSGGAGYESYLNGTHKTSGTNGYISAMQGFFVRAANTPLSIPNTARKHDNNWLKNSDATPVDQLKLTLSNGIAYDETFVVFEAEGSLNKGFYDAGKLLSMNTDVPQVYTLKETDQKISINSLPLLQNQVTVPVGMIIPTDGNYTIQLTGMETFTNLSGILLEDLKTNTTQNMVQTPAYDFSASTTDNPNRFLLHFAGTNSVGEKTGNNSFHVFSSANSIIVLDNTGKNEGNVSVYNMMGQLVATSALNGNASCRLNLNVPVGYYLVKVISSDHAYSTKVFINQR